MLSLLFTFAFTLPSLAATDLQLPSKPPRGWTETRRQSLPEVPLRGYGSLRGEYVEFTGTQPHHKASMLRMDAPDADRAAIVLGKFRSDLRALDSVSEKNKTFGKITVPIHVTRSQSFIVALRQGSSVLVITVTDESLLEPLLSTMRDKVLREADFTGGKVPAFLDKFDRWGFGFWMQDPLHVPDKQPATYDLRENFTWARQMGVSLQIDIPLNQGGGAGGVTEDNSRRWALNWAKEQGIPVSIQMQGAPAPGWLANRFADEMQLKAPHFIGNFYGVNGNNGFSGSRNPQLSWLSIQGKNQLLAELYQSVQRYSREPNVLAYGEWHGEINDGALSLFQDFGPFADTRYRDYLKSRYHSPQAVDQRWHEGQGVIKSWSDVRLPEPAEFLGWGPNAVDLQGPWRIAYEQDLGELEKARWGDPELDDTSWRELVAPGDDRQLTKTKWRVPTVFRRHFEVNSNQLATLKSQGKTYLYVLALQQGYGPVIRAFHNGKPVPDQRMSSQYAWVTFDVTSTLQEGSNHLALSLPWGELSYRIYLSSHAPRCYPDLGRGMNARWADYRDFITAMREEGVRRSVETIRRHDPEKFIKVYAPGLASDVLKAVAEDHGCYFHDTGGMSGNWSDAIPSAMRSSGLPMSLEPGNPAYSLPELKVFFGRWLTEGLNAIDYFMDITDIRLRPDQKEWFETHQPLVHLFGKFHYPETSIAVLEGIRSRRLIGVPWDSFDSPLLWHNRRNGIGTLSSMPHPRDVVHELDFARGNAQRYKVIVDDSTLIMDEALIDQIEAWVRSGGTFIAQGHIGRHTPEVPDAWPISRLTGYRIVGNNDNSRVGAIAGQPIFTDPIWNETDPNGVPKLGAAGLYLEKVAPECQDILKWGRSNAIAMGVRPLGKGRVITLGTAMPRAPSAWAELLTWCGAAPAVPARVIGAEGCRVSRFVSNNGLNDIYVLSTEGVKEPTQITLTLPAAPAGVIDLLTGKSVPVTVADNGVELRALPIEPLETRVFIVPRSGDTSSALQWFELQRRWWRGTNKPSPAPSLRPWNNTLSLDSQWFFKALPANSADAESLTVRELDDRNWDRMDLGIWFSSKYPDTKLGVFRKRITVPAAWKSSGQTWLWLRRTLGRSFCPPYKTRIYWDGELIYDSKGWQSASCSLDVSNRMTEGEHVIAIVAQSDSPIGGVPGNFWLEHIPEPVSRQSLAGDWNGVVLPGKLTPIKTEIRREIQLDAAAAGKRAVLYVDMQDNNITGLYVNGRVINRDFGSRHWLIDLTPYLKTDAPNSVTLRLQYPQNPAEITLIEMRFYEPGTF